MYQDKQIMIINLQNTSSKDFTTARCPGINGCTPTMVIWFLLPLWLCSRSSVTLKFCMCFTKTNSCSNKVRHSTLLYLNVISRLCQLQDPIYVCHCIKCRHTKVSVWRHPSAVLLLSSAQRFWSQRKQTSPEIHPLLAKWKSPTKYLRVDNILRCATSFGPCIISKHVKVNIIAQYVQILIMLKNSDNAVEASCRNLDLYFRKYYNVHF